MKQEDHVGRVSERDKEELNGKGEMKGKKKEMGNKREREIAGERGEMTMCLHQEYHPRLLHKLK